MALMNDSPLIEAIVVSNALWSIFEEQVEGRSLVQMLSLTATDTPANGRSGRHDKCGESLTEDAQLPWLC